MTALSNIRKEHDTLKCTHKVFGMVFDTSRCNTGAKNCCLYSFTENITQKYFSFFVVTTYVR